MGSDDRLDRMEKVRRIQEPISPPPTPGQYAFGSAVGWVILTGIFTAIGYGAGSAYDWVADSENGKWWGAGSIGMPIGIMLAIAALQHRQYAREYRVD